jgi:hypothetical protein
VTVLNYSQSICSGEVGKIVKTLSQDGRFQGNDWSQKFRNTRDSFKLRNKNIELFNCRCIWHSVGLMNILTVLLLLHFITKLIVIIYISTATAATTTTITEK